VVLTKLLTLVSVHPLLHKTNIYCSAGYRVIPDKEQRKFWKVGRVFMMLWTEPAAKVPYGGGTRDGSHFSTVWLSEQAYSEIRRFVVIREGHGNSICS
jgi:hypothetical protein